MQWHERSPERVERERDHLSRTFPELELETPAEGQAAVTGTMRVIDDLGYTTRLIVPGGYPKQVPTLFCDPDEIPWDLDRHVNPGNGIACLCVATEYRMYWPYESDLSDFLEALVRPFFLGQLYFESHGHWPPTGQRTHGLQGILEAYRELLTAAQLSPDDETIRRFMGLLSRKNDPKGHEICPCGSTKRLRNCHRSILNDLRSTIDPVHAKLDYDLVFP